MTTIAHNGHQFDYSAAVNLMDNDICKALNERGFAYGLDDEQEFFDAYVEAHTAKFGEAFEIN